MQKEMWTYVQINFTEPLGTLVPQDAGNVAKHPTA